MVKAVRGCLVKTEPSIREIILKIGEDENFVIEDINDEMLFVDSSCRDTLKEKVDRILSSMTKRAEGSSGS